MALVLTLRLGSVPVRVCRLSPWTRKFGWASCRQRHGTAQGKLLDSPSLQGPSRRTALRQERRSNTQLQRACDTGVSTRTFYPKLRTHECKPDRLGGFVWAHRMMTVVRVWELLGGIPGGVVCIRRQWRIGNVCRSGRRFGRGDCYCPLHCSTTFSKRWF